MTLLEDKKNLEEFTSKYYSSEIFAKSVEEMAVQAISAAILNNYRENTSYGSTHLVIKSERMLYHLSRYIKKIEKDEIRIIDQMLIDNKITPKTARYYKNITSTKCNIVQGIYDRLKTHISTSSSISKKANNANLQMYAVIYSIIIDVLFGLTFLMLDVLEYSIKKLRKINFSSNILSHIKLGIILFAINNAFIYAIFHSSYTELKNEIKNTCVNPYVKSIENELSEKLNDALSKNEIPKYIEYRHSNNHENHYWSYKIILDQKPYESFLYNPAHNMKY